MMSHGPVRMSHGLALLMVQCYLVSEDENDKINSDETVFKLLVKLLDHSIRGLGYNGVNFAVIEVIEVGLSQYVAMSCRCTVFTEVFL